MGRMMKAPRAESAACIKLMGLDGSSLRYQRRRPWPIAGQRGRLLRPAKYPPTVVGPSRLKSSLALYRSTRFNDWREIGVSQAPIVPRWSGRLRNRTKSSTQDGGGGGNRRRDSHSSTGKVPDSPAHCIFTRGACRRMWKAISMRVP